MDIDSQLKSALAALKEIENGDDSGSLRRYAANILNAFDRLSGNQSWQSIKISAIEEPSEAQIQDLQQAADEAAEWLENQRKEKLRQKRNQRHSTKHKDHNPGGFNVPPGPHTPGPKNPPDITPVSGTGKCRMDFRNCRKEQKDGGASPLVCVAWLVICIATEIKIGVGWRPTP